MRHVAIFAPLLMLCVSPAFAQSKKNEHEVLLLDASELKFEPLGPGIPMEAATAWGDVKKGPHGTFMRYHGPFASPPHLHTAAMRCVVLKGTFTHYEAGKSGTKVIGPGSLWFIPAKVKHVSECKDTECLAYCTQDKGMDSVVDPKDLPPPPPAGKSP
jgi:hypothetical protein